MKSKVALTWDLALTMAAVALLVVAAGVLFGIYKLPEESRDAVLLLLLVNSTRRDRKDRP